MAIRSKRRSTPWSAEEEAELRALAAANISRSRIAVRPQRTIRAIETKLSLMGGNDNRRAQTAMMTLLPRRAANIPGPYDHNHWQTSSPSYTIARAIP
jgi:hypothetical protein